MFTVTVSDSSGNPVFSMSDQRLTFPTNASILGQALDAANAALAALTVRAEVPPPSQDQLVSLFTQLSTKLDTITQRMTTMSDALSSRISDLQADVASNSNVVDSVKITLSNLQQELQDAMARATAAGATPQQLQSLADLHATLGQQRDALAAAVAANTPASPGGGTTTPPATPPATGTPGGTTTAPGTPTDTTGGTTPTPTPTPTEPAPTPAPTDTTGTTTPADTTGGAAPAGPAAPPPATP
jgi:hypothetical protein